jgi:CelD/BcsL family acetyltransferase involved in cellulose biosynthesis
VPTATDFSPAITTPESNPAETRRNEASRNVLPFKRPGSAVAKVEVYRDPAAVDALWAALEESAAASAYQTRAFLLPWLETLGAARDIEPLFVVAKDWRDGVLALFCLGIERQGPFRIAVFLGGKESNFNLGLVQPNAPLSAEDIRFVFAEAARLLGRDGPHLFLLQNQPQQWDGIANPLALLDHQTSPSFAYATQLQPEGEAFVAEKLSKETRKKLRKKEAKLAELGAVSVLANDGPQNAKMIVDAFLAEKIARCEARAYEANFADPAMRVFLERLSGADGRSKPVLDFYALKVGDKIVATYAGLAHRNHFSCLVNSFDSDPDIARSSPGDLLLTRLVALQCDRGRSGFDLGIGEARYKSSYCDLTIPLFDTVLPVGAVGRLCAAYAKLRLSIKRRIKQRPEIFANIRRLRQIFPLLSLL